jgi:hypothetical protein
MQDDPPQDDNLKAKWEKLYRDVCNDLEEPAQQDECLEIGWQRDAYDFDEKLIAHAEGELTWTNEVEDDPDAATMLGTANEFDLDVENPLAHVLFGGESDFDIEQVPSFFGEEVQSKQLCIF